jgi:putative membrane-bound dehydrogenase-like protein
MTLPRSFLLFLAFGLPIAGAANADLPTVPPGFKVELFAREPLVRNPCAMAFDAKGRLFVGQGPQYRNPKPNTPGDTIEILIDSDGDGVADKTKTFARGLNCIQGLAWRGRDLWVGNAPDLTIVRDLDGDDEADEYVLVYTDLGNIEHGVHGLNWGPDGKFYLSKGNSKGLTLPGRVAPRPFRELWGVTAPAGTPDMPPPRVFKKGEYKNTYHDPQDDWGREGGILRCDDLGANLEIVSRGFRNPWDIGFDNQFNWLGTDNDQSEGDRIFMPFYDAHFGWAHTWSANWTGDGHPPTAPVSGPTFTGSGTGVVYADTPGWPATHRGVWFINDFLHRTTYLYRPRWEGALMLPAGGRWEPFARGSNPLFSPIDIENGPDGAIYITGWGARLDAAFADGKQTNEGRIFRLTPAGFTAAKFNQPKRAKAIAQWTFAELAEDLGAQIPAWRTDAADELVRRGAAVRGELQSLLVSGKLPTAQETWALWTLGRCEPQNRAIDSWFAEKGHALSPNARIQSIRIAAHRVREWQRNAALPKFAIDGLNDADARVRFAAAQSLGQARQRVLAEPLWARAAVETDRLSFYAIWHALIHNAAPAELKAKLKDTRAGVRRAALLALLEQGAADEKDVEPLVKDSDAATVGIAGLWIAKHNGNSLLVIEPPAGEFTESLRVAITPGLKPSRISYSIDGSEPNPAKLSGTARFTITETTTVKAALFVDGKKVGNTAEAVYRKRAPLAAGETVALGALSEPTTLDATLPLLTKGDAKRGRALFHAAGCVACHRVGTEGGAFGPDLTGLSQRADPTQLIRSVLEPSTDITEGFALLTVTTRDGKTFAGRRQEETAATLTLMQPDNATVAIKRADIAKQESLHTSPMPAFDRVLSPQQLADVVAFLNGGPVSAPTSGLTPGGAAAAARGFAAQLGSDRVEITDSGKPVATFVFKDPATFRPAFQNVHAPGGVLITRRHPPAAPDAVDHPTMHPGIWLAFGDINGADFWRNKARLEHDGFITPPGGTSDRVGFETVSRFLNTNGEPIAKLTSTIAITREHEAYLLTWDAVISPIETDLVFGDQEEMGFGVRMTGPLIEKNGGKIALSDGKTGAKTAWGNVADWCVYSGTLDGRTVGAAIFASAANPRRPWWHTRDYGLMVANSFGKRALPAGSDGKLTIRRDETLRLKHAVLLFNLPSREAPDLAAAYRAFNAPP